MVEFHPFFLKVVGLSRREVASALRAGAAGTTLMRRTDISKRGASIGIPLQAIDFLGTGENRTT
jgi:hypothetical protein